MAKVTGPLMSLDASGTVADTITFSKWKGANYVRLTVIPNNPQTASQVSQRDTLTAGVSTWRNGVSCNATSKASWDACASGLGMSGFNRFTKKFINTNSQHEAPWVVPQPSQ